MLEALRWLRRPSARPLAALLVVVLTVATLVGGSVYQWCIPLERAMVACCCHHDEPPGDEPAIRRVCCEERAIGVLPVAQTERDEPSSSVPPVIVAAVEPPKPALARSLSTRPWRKAAPARAPPARPPPLQRKLALIQVYRC